MATYYHFIPIEINSYISFFNTYIRIDRADCFNTRTDCCSCFLFEATMKDLGSYCPSQPGAPRPDLSLCHCSSVNAHVAFISSHKSHSADIKCTIILRRFYLWLNESWCHSQEFCVGCIAEDGVRKYSLTAHLHERSKVFGLRRVDIHSEYRFQIHQASLYSIDSVQWLPWKESDYFFLLNQSEQTAANRSRADLHLTSVFIFSDICLEHIYMWWKETNRFFCY